MTVLFGAAAAEVLTGLPEATRKRAANSIDLLQHHPMMYPIRRRGIMRGYRYFVADRYLFY